MDDNTRWMDLAVEAGTLREAMVTRAGIEQAKGVIMSLRRCGPDQAFAELRSVSQRSNQKLNLIAETLIAIVSNQPPEHPQLATTIIENWGDALRAASAPAPGSHAERAWFLDN